MTNAVQVIGFAVTTRISHEQNATGQELAIPTELIERRIYLIRGHKVMLDRDLSEIYGVQTRGLVQAVSRNAERRPGDFMF